MPGKKNASRDGAAMIDWGSLLANSLWILGCSWALATLSYTSWQASLAGEKLTARLSSPGSQKSLNIAGMLFCAGLAGTSGTTWQVVLWAILGAIFLIQLIFLVFAK